MESDSDDGIECFGAEFDETTCANLTTAGFYDNATLSCGISSTDGFTFSNQGGHTMIGGINLVKLLFDNQHMIDLIDSFIQNDGSILVKRSISFHDNYPPIYSFIKRFLCCNLSNDLIELCADYLIYRNIPTFISDSLF